MKVANFPIIPGERLPKKIFTLHQRIIGFTISPALLAFFRQKRLGYLGQTDYTDIESIRKELKYSHKIYRDIQNIKVLDVSNKSIEEIAGEIIEE